MKPIIIYTKGYVFWWATGAMWFPFVVVSRKSNYIDATIRHESIHFRQCLELWAIGFYVLYLWYLIRYGYKNNPFELEAYDNAFNLLYLEYRPRFAWKKYRK